MICSGILDRNRPDITADAHGNTSDIPGVSRVGIDRVRPLRLEPTAAPQARQHQSEPTNKWSNPDTHNNTLTMSSHIQRIRRQSCRQCRGTFAGAVEFNMPPFR